MIFGKYTAFPHGSIQPQKLREGDLVLVDDGCQRGRLSIRHHAHHDVRQADRAPDARCGTWSARRRTPRWPRRKSGATCESVDAAARKVITDAGFGPGYKVPGLPHRTGHGIGLDGHEWTYLVKGNKTPLQPGMCFSDEPTIAIYGEFGVRLEDCLYVTESGARMFTRQSPAIDQPFG